MSTFYVDAALSGTGHAGTDVDPFSIAEMVTSFNATSNNIYQIKNSSATLTLNLTNVNAGHVLTNWISNQPWRIHTNYVNLPAGSTVQNGIIKTESDSNFAGNIYNCYFEASVGWSHFKAAIVKGCILRTDTYFWDYVSGAPTQIFDSILIGTPGGGSGTCQITNSACTTSTTTAFAVRNNCQFGWTAPTMPAWNAAMASFDYPTLTAGINTPPQPGNPPYTGYEKELFGNTRPGIGTGYSSIVYYTVSFNTNGGSAVDSQSIPYNQTCSQPTNPTKTGYIFSGWYSDAGLTNQFNFTTQIVTDTTLYVKWESAFSGGTGTINDPYQISTIQQLNIVREFPNSSYILMNDLDLGQATQEGGQYWNNGQGWMSIGKNTVIFSGNFDGNNKKISNMYSTINGLFYNVNGSIIKNLGLENVNIPSTDGQAGMLVGNISTSIVTNCYAKGNIFGNSYTGGLVGNSFSVYYTNCFTEGSVTGVDNVGGLVGIVDGNNQSTIDSCHSVANVTGQSLLGGLIGYATNVNTSKSYAVGDISGVNNSIGGFVGSYSNGTINSCTASGNVVMTGNNSFRVGGFAGYISGTTTNCYSVGSVTVDESTDDIGGFTGNYVGNVSNCYAIGIIIGGSNNIGGFIGFLNGNVIDCYHNGIQNGYGTYETLAALTDINTYSNWDIIDITQYTNQTWKIEDDNLPILGWETQKESFTVTFDSNGGTAVSPIIVSSNKSITKPNNPEKPPYNFVCWCSDAALKVLWDFNFRVTNNMTLYAKWKTVETFVTQKTKGHVIKSFSLETSEFSNSFGTFGSTGSGTNHLNSPWSMTVDSESQIYVCDHNNSRIVKLNGSLMYLNAVNVASTVGRPCHIYFDSSSGDLYVTGINYHTIENKILYMYINMARYSTNLSLIKYTRDVLGVNQRLEQAKGEIGYKPIAVVKGQLENEFLIAGIRNKIYRTIELSTKFDILEEVPYYVELPTRFLGMIHHSNGYYYLNNGRNILKFDATFTNMVNSDFISKTIFGLREVSNGNILVYNCDRQSILEYDQNLNFVKEVLKDSGTTIQTDFYEVSDMIQL